MNRVDHWEEALRLINEARWSENADRLVALAQVHATLATIPDSIAGALDARAKIRGRSE